MVGRILRALFYHYIKQRAKQTSKKRDNSFFTMFSPNNLTAESQGTTIATSSTGTSEKIIMETVIEPVVQIRDWSIDRIHQLAETGDIEQQFNAVAIAEEFDEWINLPEGENEINYICIQDEGWSEQEVDTL
jgi:hypothetical protein